MSYISKVSLNLSNKLGNKLNKSCEQKSVLNYGLFIILHTGLSLIITLITGIIFNIVCEIMTISIVAALLKRYSGGVHSSTPERCLIVGLFFSIIGAILDKYLVIKVNDKYLIIIGLVVLTIEFLILYIKCPVSSKNKPLNKESTRKRLRIGCFKLMLIYIVTILVNFIIYEFNQSVISKSIAIGITIGIFIQVFALTKVGNKFIKLSEIIFNLVKIK
ncbi:accessory gene regulator ArgB-like protein [Romboutsia sp.]|uniref:accessory gene regulator ArgB-like protein n=1 Tax=Romboutsia sp. TaxID=1965302 RepID=UPI003F32240D